MSGPPLISCIVPVYNGERFLAEAIDSILAQDHRPLEVIVVDDGSTDASAEIAERYGRPVTVLRRARGGQSAACNDGIRAARGEYLSFLDADDLYRPGKLGAQLAELEAHPDADLCLCVAENFWEPGLEAERELYTRLGKVQATSHLGTLLLRRSAVPRLGPMDPRRGSAADIEWFLRAADLGLAVRTLPTVLYSRRMHAASTSHNLTDLDSYFALVHDRIRHGRPPADER